MGLGRGGVWEKVSLKNYIPANTVKKEDFFKKNRIFFRIYML
jgi:hypothetical protein